MGPHIKLFNKAHYVSKEINNYNNKLNDMNSNFQLVKK